MCSFSVIIPTLNEERTIEACLTSVQQAGPADEIIVIDGGSNDNTIRLARQRGVQVHRTKPGRGIQCNAGTSLATGDILLFLHADTRLPDNAMLELRHFFGRKHALIGTFKLAFDAEYWLLDMYAWFSRFDSLLTTFGDQGIAIRRSFFRQLGGFPDWPLFEDVKLLQKARQVTHVYKFSATVTTSARRYVKEGVIRRQLRNGWLILQYLLGVPPHQLAMQYNQEHGKLAAGIGYGSSQRRKAF